MTTTNPARRPVTLQTRLMAAVIGFVSLILIIVAVITSATLGTTLENQLDQKVLSNLARLESYTDNRAPLARITGQELTAEMVMKGVTSADGVVLAIAGGQDSIPPSGVVVEQGTTTPLTQTQLRQIDQELEDSRLVTVTIDDLGSYRIAATQTQHGGITVVTGLPRDEIQNTLARLFTVIAMATLGGLILLALTTAITIRVGLRPLRAVAATATRVANQPLDRGEVSITERVPAAEADPRTETGLVGAALNTLLDHVDSSLSARQQNEERMRRFVADASHELRTPLASIRGYSELSLKALSRAEQAGTAATPAAMESTGSALERIQAQSIRMTRLVEDLLLLARLDEGRELVHGTVDLTQLAVEGVADARPTAPDHAWDLEIPAEPVTVVGDAGRLHQVVTNLLANARTHTPAGTTITMTVSQDGDHGILRVHDDGPGIDPAVRDELFARFVRGDSSRARQTGGTGLGLAIVKAIVDGHHGDIAVDSEPGSTTFTVRLPVNPASPGRGAGGAS
ncbi:sensor histidine kinase [Microbacterium sp. M28]|uniref:sensor histidine kinase n=1 Tax=Microbacterium sp. M28 TaxID=2962064 RepID=UPI00298F67F5|nr:ATP-binding protein [Microbacterium sp. M28]